MSSGASITANGQAGYTVGTYTGGAGAGGSIWVSAADVAGTGTLSANGGARSSGYYAGGGETLCRTGKPCGMRQGQPSSHNAIVAAARTGGGGRVAVRSTGSLSPTVIMQAIGGYGSRVNPGGAGTVYHTSSTEKVLQIDNDNRGYTRDTPVDPVRHPPPPPPS